MINPSDPLQLLNNAEVEVRNMILLLADDDDELWEECKEKLTPMQNLLDDTKQLIESIEIDNKTYNDEFIDKERHAKDMSHEVEMYINDLMNKNDIMLGMCLASNLPIPNFKNNIERLLRSNKFKYYRRRKINAEMVAEGVKEAEENGMLDQKRKLDGYLTNQTAKDAFSKQRGADALAAARAVGSSDMYLFKPRIAPLAARELSQKGVEQWLHPARVGEHTIGFRTATRISEGLEAMGDSLNQALRTSDTNKDSRGALLGQKMNSIYNRGRAMTSKMKGFNLDRGTRKASSRRVPPLPPLSLLPHFSPQHP